MLESCRNDIPHVGARNIHEPELLLGIWGKQCPDVPASQPREGDIENLSDAARVVSPAPVGYSLP